VPRVFEARTVSPSLSRAVRPAGSLRKSPGDIRRRYSERSQSVQSLLWCIPRVLGRSLAISTFITNAVYGTRYWRPSSYLTSPDRSPALYP
jgi:hypothetical protein